MSAITSQFTVVEYATLYPGASDNGFGIADRNGLPVGRIDETGCFLAAFFRTEEVAKDVVESWNLRGDLYNSTREQVGN